MFTPSQSTIKYSKKITDRAVAGRLADVKHQITFYGKNVENGWRIKLSDYKITFKLSSYNLFIKKFIHFLK